MLVSTNDKKRDWFELKFLDSVFCVVYGRGREWEDLKSVSKSERPIRSWLSYSNREDLESVSKSERQIRSWSLYSNR